jgi:glycosyltransferase involved in cell wall biosynthesis
MKIKILHVTQATIGGTLEYLKLLLLRLDSNLFDITVICPSYGPMADELKALGIKVKIIDMTREISIKDDFKAIKELYKYIKKNRFDIIHLHSSKAGAIGRIANLFTNIPCVYTPHGWAFNMKVSSKKKLFYKIIEKILAYMCESIVAISPAERNDAIKFKISKNEKIRLITNGIDINKFNFDFNFKIRDKLKISKKTKIIGMVGRLSLQKDPLTFVKVAKLISDRGYNTYFMLVGDGELRKDVEEKIELYGLKNKFLITGWTNEVEKYVSCFDVGVLTSQWEGFGLVLAEYMAAKIPIVASKVDGICDVVKDKYSGVLVSPGDVEGFANKIITILEDEELANKYVKNGYERVVKEFSIERVVKQHENLYKELLNINRNK